MSKSLMNAFTAIGHQPTLMEAFAEVERITNAPGKRIGAHDADKDARVIAGRQIPRRVANSLRTLFAPYWNGDYAASRNVVVAELSVDKHNGSVTRALAERFPNLQLRNLWVTTGGPEIDDQFCRFVVEDLVAEFNEWARTSGFNPFIDGCRARKDYAHKFNFGDVKMELTSPWMWGGMAEQFELGDERLTLSYRKPEAGFFAFTFNCSLQHAVTMLDTFMNNWKSE